MQEAQQGNVDAAGGHAAQGGEHAEGQNNPAELENAEGIPHQSS